MTHRGLVAIAAASLIAPLACGTSGTLGPLGELAEGTWGGENAGVIVTADGAHVHVGCTNGDFPGVIELNDEGRFSVAGEYLLTAYPVARGPTMPARFAGVVDDNTLVMTVAVDDTIADQLVVLGPVTVRLGRDPQLGPCPICVM